VNEELAKRKAKGTYKGSFAPVTHFFGYQGRAAHPSNFDCQLGTTLGFTAGCLLQQNATAMAVTVKDLTQSVTEWRCGGVPILSLLRSQPKAGYKRHELVVPSQEV
jgi:6-phosphofructokinase